MGGLATHTAPVAACCPHWEGRQAVAGMLACLPILHNQQLAAPEACAHLKLNDLMVVAVVSVASMLRVLTRFSACRLYTDTWQRQGQAGVQGWGCAGV